MRRRMGGMMQAAMAIPLLAGIVGFGPGDCGGLPDEPCSALGEDACWANAECEALYDRGGAFAECRSKVHPTPRTCVQLGETECLARTDCQAFYASFDGPGCVGGTGGPRCGTQFDHCGPAQNVCPALACLMYVGACPNGVKKDANGCDTCECLPEQSCEANTDCPAGQGCVRVPCAPIELCSELEKGVCQAIECPPLPCPWNPPCAYGKAKDANGCDTCECGPGVCSFDADCHAGDHCEYLSPRCGPPGARCATPPTGQCVPDVCPEMMCLMACAGGNVMDSRGCATCQCACVSDAECTGPDGRCVGGVCATSTCSNDADCQQGEQCLLPDWCADCVGSAGTCVPRTCQANADCRVGEFCETYPLDCVYNAPACLPPEPFVCKPLPCGRPNDILECPVGSICRPDPTDPCNTQYLCVVMGRQICLPESKCSGLDEASCSARADCTAVYAPANCPSNTNCGGMVFHHCE